MKTGNIFSLLGQQHNSETKSFGGTISMNSDTKKDKEGRTFRISYC